MKFHEEFLDSLAVGAYRTRTDGTIEYANHALVEMLGYPTIEKLKESNARYFYFDEHDRERWQSEMERSANDKLICFETHWRKLHSEKRIHVKKCTRAVRENGIIVAYEGIAIDITSVSTDAKPLSASESAPEALINLGFWNDRVKNKLPVCISRKNHERRIVWINDAFCRAEGLSREKILNESNTDLKIYGEAFDLLYREGDDLVFKTGKPHFAIEKHPSKSRGSCQVQVVKVPVFDRLRQVVAVESIFWTIAESDEDRRKDEQIERQLQSQFNVVYEHNLEGIFTRVNQGAEKLTGWKVEEWIGKHYNTFVAPEHREFADARTRAKLTAPVPADAITSYEIDLIGADGHHIPVEITSRLIIKQSKAIAIIGYVRDLTTRKEAEQSRLREIHHRVKNNLHTIYSLLGSESDRAEFQETRDAIDGCRARILTIAALHQQLYESARVDQIDVGAYIRHLVEQLVRTYSRAWQDIQPRISVGNDIHLSLDALSPCALVLHELVSNAMKHAFPGKSDSGKRRGNLFVSLSRRFSNRGYVLRVEDTGVGLPSGFSLNKTRSVGLSLVLGLVEKELKGRVEVASNTASDTSSSGTSFTIEFIDPVSRSVTASKEHEIAS